MGVSHLREQKVRILSGPGRPTERSTTVELPEPDATTRLGRFASIGLVAAITIDNAISAGGLDYAILKGHTGQDAIGLLGSGAAIYGTNVIA